MALLITPAKAQEKLAKNLRLKRLDIDLTQKGLSERSGVPLPTLRKFEQKGTISLESFLKLLRVLGGLEDILQTLEPSQTEFSSIDDVLDAGKTPPRKRGRRQ
ncbi:hypothetical protein MNBD_GAMMA13-6 [hydrothermal vent metagenome]|uniref:HTH cro/C1-type domain-containing protein n=1 Tax=hydrothermal vent metagenome TaxID=652676 RepID=A0A3B0ZLP4_9ZZZZ